MLKIFLKFISIQTILLSSLSHSVSIAQESPINNIAQEITIECLKDTSEKRILSKKADWEARWTPVEKWVLNKLCAGEQRILLNNFSENEKEKNIQNNIDNLAEESKRNNDSSDIQLSPEFIMAVLGDEDLKDKLPSKIELQNGRIKHKEEDTVTKLDLSSVNLDKEINFKNFIFDMDVTLAKAKISQSIYFDNSTFKGTLAMNEAEVKGNIFLRNVKFVVDKQRIERETEKAKNVENRELIFINLRGIKVDSSVNLKSFKFDLKTTECNFQGLNDTLSIYSLSASGGKVSKSIIMEDANFQLCPQNAKKFKILKGVQLDYIKLEQNLELNAASKFHELDLQNAQLNTIIIKINNDFKTYLNHLKLIEILREKPNQDSSHYFKSSEYETGFSSLQEIVNKAIKIEDVKAKNFQLESPDVVSKKGTEEGDSGFNSTLDNKSQKPDHKNSKNSTELKKCSLEIDGFNYENINQTAFYLLILCLNSKYTQIQENVNNNQENNNQEIIQLFQPLEQAAKASRNLGRYDLERELLYKRKKLEIYIAPSFWEKSILIIQDFMYGFGYHRNKILYFFLLIWSPGFLVAYFQLEYKQKMILNDVCKVVKQEREDEELKTANIIELDKVSKYIDSIQEVIFCGSIDRNRVTNERIKVPFIFQKNQGNKELWFKIYLITLTPTISILVSTYLSFYGSLLLSVLPCILYIVYKLVKSNHHLDIKDVIPHIFITFKDENNKNEQLFYSKKVMDIENDQEYLISVNPQNHEDEIKQLFSIQKNLGNDVDNTYFRLNLSLNDEDGLSHKNHQDTILDFIERLDVRNPNNRKIGLCHDLFPVSKLFLIFCMENENNNNPEIICFYDSDKDLFYVEDGKRILLWRSWKSAVFSIDILLPLVDLDPELHQFIFDDSEGLTRGYFIVQKILATIIASVLLPVLFITGL